MKIDIPANVINDLLKESQTFRSYVIDMLNQSTNVVEQYRAQIRKLYPNWSTNKIPPVKWIRDEVRGRDPILAEFAKYGYDITRGTADCMPTLSLVGAKQFVESC